MASTILSGKDWDEMMKKAILEDDLIKRRSLMNAVQYVPPSMNYDPEVYTHSVARPGPSRWSESQLSAMLSSRFAWDIEGCPFRRVVPFKVNDEKIAIFVVTADESFIFEDEPKLYPSDALMTQLRLLLEAM